MKINNPSPSRNRRFWLALTAGLLVLAGLNFTGLDGGIKNFFLTLQAPLQKILWEKGRAFNFWIEAIQNMGRGQQERDRLRSENQALQSRLLQLEPLARENNELRKALDLGLEKDFRMIAAHTLTKDSFQDAVLIDKGARDGLKKGMVVVTAERIFVGQVQETLADFSWIRLASHQQSVLSGKIVRSPGDVIGLVKGQGNSRLLLDLVPQEQSLRSGDRVVTTGPDKNTPEQIVPANLLIGEITAVNSSDVKPFQSAQLKPFWNFKDLDVLFVIAGRK